VLSAPPQWIIDDQPVDYARAVAEMEERVEAIHAGMATEAVWLLEHPPLYSAGSSAKPEDLLQPDRFPVFQTGRGGQYTYHGPGQRVAYVMLDLTRRDRDVRRFVRDLEAWLIATLALFGVRGERRDGRVGIWVCRGGGREDKIAAIGVRLRHWISYHGISLNIDPDLGHYSGIIPCGLSQYGVTSLWDLGLTPSRFEVDMALRQTFDAHFGAVKAGVADDRPGQAS
jgi:lipoyl(octanoyl) transferase